MLIEDRYVVEVAFQPSFTVGVNDSKETRVVKPMSTEEQIIDINNLFGALDS